MGTKKRRRLEFKLPALGRVSSGAKIAGYEVQDPDERSLRLTDGAMWGAVYDEEAGAWDGRPVQTATLAPDGVEYRARGMYQGDQRYPVYFLHWPKCADAEETWLGPELVQEIQQARWALSFVEYQRLQTLRHHAEAMYRHPVIFGETMQRDGLYERLVVPAVQAYFWMLGDLLDPTGWQVGPVDKQPGASVRWPDGSVTPSQTGSRPRHTLAYHWHRLAGLLFWWGRTGAAFYERAAELHDLLGTLEAVEAPSRATRKLRGALFEVGAWERREAWAEERFRPKRLGAGDAD